ncbi:MAG TPA: hypothetical protein PLB91_01035 [Spirochaetales bacterium]|nr:hypothetical protein [Spirochaetales bacterium]
MNSISHRSFVILKAELIKQGKSCRRLQARSGRIPAALDHAEKTLRDALGELRNLEQELLQMDLFEPSRPLVDQLDEAPAFTGARSE